jgi:predicted metalloprotease with PDZ domain
MPGRAHVHYRIDVTGRAQHSLHISVSLDPGHEQARFRIPSWYALYQIRNFSQFLRSPRAIATDGSELPLRSVDKATWTASTRKKAAKFEYDIVCNIPGPYGLEVTSARITVNPALALIYFPDARAEPLDVTFQGVPADWQTSSTLTVGNQPFYAKNYEEIADSPFWLGYYAQQTYTEGQTTVRILVDAALGDYDMAELVRRNHRLVSIESHWMGGLPTDRYTFFYRFASDAGEDGMEHANGTFISAPATETKVSMNAVDNVTAHEFFHLWNVMRIRPCSMEPIDFAHEQYSPTLWFSEGFTSAASRLFLLRAGYLTETDFLARLAGELRDLQDSSANSWQSAEDASVSVWLSGTEPYDSSERSISYYRKGELLAYLLDLRMREETNGKESLQDLFRLLQSTYGAQTKCFEDAGDLQAALEALTGKPESEFFTKFVTGHDELPFPEYFASMGLAIDANGIHEQVNASPKQTQQRRRWLQASTASDQLNRWREVGFSSVRTSFPQNGGYEKLRAR